MVGHYEEGQLSNPLTRDEERDALVKEIVKLKAKLSQFHTDREHQIKEAADAREQIQYIELDRTRLRRRIEGLETTSRTNMEDIREERQLWDLDREKLRTELTQVRASFDLLRGNFNQARERWRNAQPVTPSERTNFEREISWLKSEDKLRDDRVRLDVLEYKEIIRRQEHHIKRLQKEREIREELEEASQPTSPFWVTSSAPHGYMVMGPGQRTWFKREPRKQELHDIWFETPELALGLCKHVCELLNKAWKEEKAD